MAIEDFTCDICGDTGVTYPPMFHIEKWTGQEWFICSNECLRRLDPILEVVREEKKSGRKQ